MTTTEFNEKLIKGTIEMWSKEYGYRISREDAIEIIYSLRNFAEVLIDIYFAEKKRENKNE